MTAGRIQPARARAGEQRSPLTTRQVLLDVAARLFAEKGYAETSMREIARHASLTTGALYVHFRNKADLLAEVINSRIVEEFGEAVSLDDVDPREALSRSATDYASRSELRALIIQGAAAAQTDPETRDSLRDEQRQHLDRWITGYEREREALGLDPSVDSEAAVLFTWAAEVGLGVLQVLGIAPSPEGWADAHDRLMRGLHLPPEARDPAKRQ